VAPQVTQNLHTNEPNFISIVLFSFADDKIAKILAVILHCNPIYDRNISHWFREYHNFLRLER